MRGATLIELMTVLAVATVVVGSLFALLGAGIKGRLIVHARVSDQERGRQALSWIGDRLRQANYVAQAACPDGIVLAGNGSGFAQRLAFRATIDERQDPARRLYVYYVENRMLWQETPAEDEGACEAEAVRPVPDPRRVSLTPRIVRVFSLDYLDRNGERIAAAAFVRLVRITLIVEAESAPGRLETQTYQTVVTIRAP
jgi:type II secretory pathway component PulJ